MKIAKASFVIVLALYLAACGRSRESQFYVLNPVPPQKIQTRAYQNLRIGIDKVSIPGYAQRSQLTFLCSRHRLNIDEYHQWAEPLNDNVMRVISTNLSTLLSGAVVEASPWDSKFSPEYHVQVSISQYEVDVHGNSILRAGYRVYAREKIIKTQEACYQLKLSPVTPETLVFSMNKNLSRLTYDMAEFFKRYKTQSVKMK